eukprot:3733470-Rhodomonas_salina.1
MAAATTSASLSANATWTTQRLACRTWHDAWRCFGCVGSLGGVRSCLCCESQVECRVLGQRRPCGSVEGHA